MNSSVTWESATSVMSSLCLEISARSRSNGPSKTSRCTSKPPAWAGRAGAAGGLGRGLLRVQADGVPGGGFASGFAGGGFVGAGDPAGQQAVLAAGVEVGEQHRD